MSFLPIRNVSRNSEVDMAEKCWAWRDPPPNIPNNIMLIFLQRVWHFWYTKIVRFDVTQKKLSTPPEKKCLTPKNISKLFTTISSWSLAEKKQSAILEVLRLAEELIFVSGDRSLASRCSLWSERRPSGSPRRRPASFTRIFSSRCCQVGLIPFTKMCEGEEELGVLQIQSRQLGVSIFSLLLGMVFELVVGPYLYRGDFQTFKATFRAAVGKILFIVDDVTRAPRDHLLYIRGLSLGLDWRGPRSTQNWK